jgi:hypothetical protein
MVKATRLPSRSRELSPEPLTDPDLILSHHPARAINVALIGPKMQAWIGDSGADDVSRLRRVRCRRHSKKWAKVIRPTNIKAE